MWIEGNLGQLAANRPKTGRVMDVSYALGDVWEDVGMAVWRYLEVDPSETRT